jgi:hypothetical protein
MTNIFCVLRENRVKMAENLRNLEDQVEKLWNM